jgi:pantothenate kinase
MEQKPVTERTEVPVLTVGPDGRELSDLVRSWRPGRRRLVGVVGEPGAGKSHLAMELTRLLGSTAAHVPMDGFHLADVELTRLSIIDRKGAPETFDAWGYAALLRRLRQRPPYVVYAPGFERELEQPIAGAIPVDPTIEVVVTEGNYLLLDRPEWREVRSQLDEVWYVDMDPAVRLDRLIARHVEFGKSPDQAQAWVQRVDEGNARVIAESRSRADRIIDVTAWNGSVELGNS